MSNIEITNVDLARVQAGPVVCESDTLTLNGAQTVEEGTILARDSVSSNLVLFVPGGSAEKATSDGPFNFDPGDTLVLDVNDAGSNTATFDAAPATITDTTTYPVADQDGKTEKITISGGVYDGVEQTVTFPALTTALAAAAAINDQCDGLSATTTGGQVVLTTDNAGTDADITIGTGTTDLTWGASTAGTGDVADIDNVTATEFKTVVEADTDATVTVVGDAAVMKATVELDIVSGNVIAKAGLEVETITANENGIPKKVMGYELAGVNGNNAVRPIKSGKVRENKLVVSDGSSVTAVIKDQLRDYAIIPVTVVNQAGLDNQ